MKVLVLTNLYPPDVIGGYELGCRQVVDALRGRGHDVRVLTSAPRTPAPTVPHVRRRLKLTDIWSQYLFAHSAPVTVYLGQEESARVSAFNVHALLEELEEFRPDVVYVWLVVAVGGLGLLACLHHLRVPWVMHLMDDVPLMLCKASGTVIPTLAREFGRQLRGTYLACSLRLVEEIEAGGIALGGDVEVVPNWVAGPRRAPRSEYLQGGILRVVSAAGQIERQVDKGMDLLVEAAAMLVARGRDRFVIDLYGHVADDSVPALIRSRGVGERVRLMGPRSQAELSDRFADYDVFAFPTRPREPFGFAPLEGASRGCVPLISEFCGLSEWLVHGVHGLKAPRTAEAFADALERILAGGVDLAAIGRRAASVVSRDFHLDAIVPRIEAVLGRVAGRCRAGAGTAEEAYRMALLAENLSRVLVQEPHCA